nr:hypothetical protein [Tanacetum cinerariifolium]
MLKRSELAIWPWGRYCNCPTGAEAQMCSPKMASTRGLSSTPSCTISLAPPTHFGRAQQHGHVGVVAAGVHHAHGLAEVGAFDGAGKGQAAGLGRGAGAAAGRAAERARALLHLHSAAAGAIALRPRAAAAAPPRRSGAHFRGHVRGQR